MLTRLLLRLSAVLAITLNVLITILRSFAPTLPSDGQLMYAVSTESASTRIILFDVMRDISHVVYETSDASIYQMHWSPDGRFLFMSSINSIIYILDIEQGGRVTYFDENNRTRNAVLFLGWLDEGDSALISLAQLNVENPQLNFARFNMSTYEWMGLDLSVTTSGLGGNWTNPDDNLVYYHDRRSDELRQLDISSGKNSIIYKWDSFDESVEWLQISPDAQHFSGVAVEQTPNSRTSDLFLIHVESGDTHNLTNSNTVNESQSVWSHGLDAIAYRVTDADAKRFLYKISTETEETQIIYEAPSPFIDLFIIGWSPQDTQLAFIESNQVEMKLCLIDMGGQQHQHCPLSEIYLSAAAWRPE